MTRVYVHPLPERVLHWVNAFGFVALILAGLQIRYRVFDALPPKAVIDVHNRIGFLLIANFAIWLVYHPFSDRICVFHPEPRRARSTGPCCAGGSTAVAGCSRADPTRTTWSSTAGSIPCRA